MSSQKPIQKDWMILLTSTHEAIDIDDFGRSTFEKRIHVESKSDVRSAIHDHWPRHTKLTFRWLSRVDSDCKLIYEDGELVGQYQLFYSPIVDHGTITKRQRVARLLNR